VKRLHILVTIAVVAMLAMPAVSNAQVRVRGGVGVRVGSPRGAVIVGGGYYRPYYRSYYRPLFYDPWYWYPSPFWYPPGYGYGYGYGYQSPYYYGGGASLRLQVNPRETEVFIDGYYAGTVDDFDGFFQRLNLEPGEHDLELYLPDHRIAQQKIYLQPGKTFRVRHDMEPLQPGDAEPVRPAGGPPPTQAGTRRAPVPPPPDRDRDRRGAIEPRTAPARVNDYGTLALRVQPADAEVLIDGERWAGSPGDERLEVQLSTGAHNLEVRKDGYRIYSTDVTIRGGETATLNVALRKQ
jgi:PEGA domain